MSEIDRPDFIQAAPLRDSVEDPNSGVGLVVLPELLTGDTQQLSPRILPPKRAPWVIGADPYQPHIDGLAGKTHKSEKSGPIMHREAVARANDPDYQTTRMLLENLNNPFLQHGLVILALARYPWLFSAGSDPGNKETPRTRSARGRRLPYPRALMLLGLFLAGCGADIVQSTQPPPETTPVSLTQTPVTDQPIESPTRTPTPTQTAVPTPEATATVVVERVENARPPQPGDTAVAVDSISPSSIYNPQKSNMFFGELGRFITFAGTGEEAQADFAHAIQQRHNALRKVAIEAGYNPDELLVLHGLTDKNSQLITVARTTDRALLIPFFTDRSGNNIFPADMNPQFLDVNGRSLAFNQDGTTKQNVESFGFLEIDNGAIVEVGPDGWPLIGIVDPETGEIAGFVNTNNVSPDTGFPVLQINGYEGKVGFNEDKSRMMYVQRLLNEDGTLQSERLGFLSAPEGQIFTGATEIVSIEINGEYRELILSTTQSIDGEGNPTTLIIDTTLRITDVGTGITYPVEVDENGTMTVTIDGLKYEVVQDGNGGFQLIEVETEVPTVSRRDGKAYDLITLEDGRQQVIDPDRPDTPYTVNPETGRVNIGTGVYVLNDNELLLVDRNEWQGTIQPWKEVNYVFNNVPISIRSSQSMPVTMTLEAGIAGSGGFSKVSLDAYDALIREDATYITEDALFPPTGEEAMYNILSYIIALTQGVTFEQAQQDISSGRTFTLTQADGTVSEIDFTKGVRIHFLTQEMSPREVSYTVLERSSSQKISYGVEVMDDGSLHLYINSKRSENRSGLALLTDPTNLVFTELIESLDHNSVVKPEHYILHGGRRYHYAVNALKFINTKGNGRHQGDIYETIFTPQD